MKRYIIIAAVALALFVFVRAQAADLKQVGGHLYTYPSYTLLSAVTETGAGTAEEFTVSTAGARAVPVWMHLLTATYSGITPSYVNINIELTQDGTNFYTASTWSFSSSPSYTYLPSSPGTKIRATYTSKGSYTTGATSVTLTGVSGGVK